MVQQQHCTAVVLYGSSIVRQQHCTGAAFNLHVTPVCCCIHPHCSYGELMGQLMGLLLHSHIKAKHMGPKAKRARSSTVRRQRLYALQVSRALQVCVLLCPSPVIALGSLLGQLVAGHNWTNADGSSNDAGMQQHLTTGAVAIACLHCMSVVTVSIPSDIHRQSIGATGTGSR
jgi:hypothetical protein